MGFVRRYSYFPGIEQITAIEGVTIVDLAPPGAINGAGTGVVALVGEFQDATYAVSVSSGGIVTSNPTPVEVYSGQDFLDKVGGFDETIGRFGEAQGNGFASLRNKTFARLVVVPVDNVTPAAGGSGGIRIWRDLPTNVSHTNATPITPVPGAVVAAGRQFINGVNTCRLAKRFAFSDAIAFKSGVDGSVTTGAAASTQDFTSAGGDFVNNGVQVGDILVTGTIGTSLGANAGTYRVTVVAATVLTVQRMDGVNFNFTTEATLPYRVHVAATADSAGAVAAVHAALVTATGYVLPARPLVATLTTALVLTPSVVPAAGTVSAYDPLSGLGGKTHPTQALTFDANVHGVSASYLGAANNATLAAKYSTAIDACMNDEAPSRDINVVVSSRKSYLIRAKLKEHVATASSRGLTRTCVLSPELTAVTMAAVISSTDGATPATAAGVGANRSDRIDYSWPGCTHSVPEAVGFTLTTADGKTTADGILDDSFDVWLAAILSNLLPERNPGQATDPIPTVLAPVLGFQRGIPKLGMPEYTSLRSYGIAALKMDRIAGPIIQSGVTTSLVTAEKNIARRRMADFIQDSVAAALVMMSKLPLSTSMKDGALGEVDAFLNGLLSPNNAAAQRIDAYQLDDRSGNTPALTARGIHVIIGRVKLTPTADFIVFQSEIGEGVNITTIL